MTDKTLVTITREMFKKGQSVAMRVLPNATEDEIGSVVVGVFFSMYDELNDGNVAFEFEGEEGEVHTMGKNKTH